VEHVLHKPGTPPLQVFLNRLQKPLVREVKPLAFKLPINEGSPWRSKLGVHTMTFHCILVVLALCGVLRDRPVMAMAAINAAAATWDGIETREGINAGWGEADPLTRPFVHTNGAMIAAGVAEIAGGAIIAHKMRQSRHRVLRDTWFFWQTVPIAAHIVSSAAWVRAR
jgi:hypothetical protein